MTNLGVSDTVVICRPDQIREAATVLSCCPVDTMTPLFVLAPPPCTETRYHELYRRYRSMRDRRDADLGTAAAVLAWRKQRVDPATKPAWSDQEIDKRVAALSPFRSWIKRQSLLAAIYGQLPLRRALCLFDATEQELSVIEPQSVDRLSNLREPLLARGVERLFLPAAADQPLWQRAWEILRPGESPPPCARAVGGDSVSLLAGLHRARRLGQPLCVSEAIAAVDFALEAAPGAAETVIVEATDDAATLLAVFYALRQNARFCVYPRPVTTSVERARKAIESWQSSPHGPAETAPLGAIEAAVARLVPDAVIDAVGDLPVTAWTGAVPYHLLKKAGCDWSGKAIGLMTGDALLLATLELFRHDTTRLASGAHPTRLQMIFDPGFFDTDETAGVTAALSADAGCVLTMAGRAASSAALIAAGNAPLELLYFNTHGSGDAVILKDMPLPGYKLLQRVTLRSHPIVFNNSCLSWTGVGRECIAAGARGFIGTLWSVGAAQAAALAIDALRHMVTRARPIAVSLRASHADTLTGKAYVFVGPVCAAFRASDPVGDQRARLTAQATLLIDMALYLASSGPAPDSPLLAAELQALHSRIVELVTMLDQRWPAPDATTLPLLTSRIRLASVFDLRQAGNAQQCVTLCKAGLALAAGQPGIPSPSLDEAAHFWLVCSRVSRKFERWADVITLLTHSIDRQDQAGRKARDEYLDRSDAYARLKRFPEALADAEQAQRAFTSADPNDQDAHRGAMLAAGRLAGLYRKAGRLDAALAAAQAGYRAAVTADDLAEQATFQADESSIFQAQGKHAEAVASADAALTTARRGRNEDKELEILGTLTLALLAAEDWPRAASTASEGLAAARRRRRPTSAVWFLCDLAAASRGAGDARSAYARLLQAAALIVPAGGAEQGLRVLGDSDALLTATRTWDSQCSALNLTLSLLPALSDEGRILEAMRSLGRLLGRVADTGWAASLDPLWRARRDLKQRLDALAEPAVEQHILFDVVDACYARAKGQLETAKTTAARVDAATNGACRLVDFVASGDHPDHPAWQQPATDPSAPGSSVA